jgi:hypothetical protein
MKYTATFLALATAVLATPVPQGVTEQIEPPTPAPPGCSPDVSGTFNIQIVNVSSTPAKVKVSFVPHRGSNNVTDISQRQTSGTLTLTLQGGILKDQAGRTGYVAANDQFQFDDPPQTGAVYTAGFSLCANNTLAIGGSAIWWQCLSGSFYNLYSEKQGDQCNEVYYEAINGGMAGSGGSGSSSGAASQVADGQPQESGAVSQVRRCEQSSAHLN